MSAPRSKAILAKVEIWRTSGAIEHHEVPRPQLLKAIHRWLNCELTDTVNLRDGRVMIVDDLGWECESVEIEPGHIELKPVRALKPINVEATRLYRTLSKPGTTHQIAGDVAIAWDEDFA